MDKGDRLYIMAYAACMRASIRTMAMQSQNMDCLIKQRPMMYKEADFLKVIDEEMIGYNEIISLVTPS